jgi:hypothetical protein
MSADIWLEYEGERVQVTDDLDAEMREMIPMRSSGEVTSESFNLTYNLSPMLRAAGFPGWREVVDRKASEVAPIFREVHSTLTREPAKFYEHNPRNGWGSYEDAVVVIGGLADACEAHPDAIVKGWL